MAKAVGSRELKTRFGSYLRLVRAGQSFVVTDRGRPVAELRPIARSKDDRQAVLRDLEARGVITLPRGGPIPVRRLAAVRGRPLSETLLEDREDRF